MSSLLIDSKWFTLLLIGTAVFVLIASMAYFYIVTPKTDDSWKDRPPIGFRIALAVIQPFLPYVRHLASENQRIVVRDRLTMGGLGYMLRPDEFIATRWLGLMVGVLIFIILYH